ncbi:ATP-binding protein [Aetokthonos hydrillicola Thurmond2011]|jgi:light-regulated signal transduction histidine kinase (bacteriophytochrome)|uniref:histidine kinase n=1 Tax=Aetokthonos hydrillicola Thurmond2011 TaxID=2712845 RepID=A0AAP5I4I4_9CYAN|nr:ATP-binding protein [Aetokthonos hydrillicola]MBO3459028.1 GAF domain-containing protein [Aetokthonos hydrillicola CCALA 1050]MBW4590039.1 GAF domain-containing protein [Aetokthonos hydrillicola CCALA 1050]MDR9894907.1 ATP-binding protein [Aetokthonos hydrillicola Thurmond2011]
MSSNCEQQKSSQNQSENIISQSVDLTNCDREPIHIPGLIQPHGILLVIEEPELKIIQVSNNTFELINRHPEELLNKPLKNLLSSKQVLSIKQCLLEEFETVNPLKISIKNNKKEDILFDAIIHRYDGLLICELEPKNLQENTDFETFYHLVKNTINKLQKSSTLQEMCQVVVKEVRKLTDFERVMIYQFNDEGVGSVIAEDKAEDLTPYLGLHYPASDIPKQAKKLYTLNWLRLIPSASYQPVELIPVNNPLTKRPVDLSLSVLRSVSPIHLEYLKNMGVDASMSISLIREKKLWGLIACHHSSPRYVSYSIRTACEFIGQIMSLELANKQENEDLDYSMKLKMIQSKFVESIPQSKNFIEGLLKYESGLLDIVSAQGVAICLDEQWTILGKTPQQLEMEELLAWVNAHSEDNIFYTHSLSKVYPQAKKFQGVASGLLALTISKVHKNYILWFRPEVIQTVNWGGNPDKPVELLEDGSQRLSPRKSFELWQQTVQGHSLPWKPCEIEAVTELRSAIVAIVLRQADELAKINIELERSNSELDAFAYIASHDLKEPLRGIHNYSTFLIEDYADVLNEEGVSKLQTLVRLTQRMEDLIDSLLHFSRLGRVELSWQPTNLNEVVQNVIDVLNLSMGQPLVDIRIPKILPSIVCDQVQINELFTNLISNAIKYHNKLDRWVEIGFLNVADLPKIYNNNIRVDEHKPQSMLVFYVKDNGIGIRERHLETIFRIFKRLHGRSEYGGGTGAGLTIAKKIVERHGGQIWVESTFGEGSTFYFTLPG